MSSRQRLSARVTGRVQGVGYRWWVVDQATQLGLVGWVQNSADMSAVDLVVEGDPGALDELEARLADGPGAARVDHVVVDRVPATGGLTRFEIRR